MTEKNTKNKKNKALVMLVHGTSLGKLDVPTDVQDVNTRGLQLLKEVDREGKNMKRGGEGKNINTRIPAPSESPNFLSIVYAYRLAPAANYQLPRLIRGSRLSRTHAVSAK